MEKQEEFTINIDVAIRAKHETDAVRKISNILSTHKLSFWIGEILREKDLKQFYEKKIKS